jgi:hypothetical protein
MAVFRIGVQKTPGSMPIDGTPMWVEMDGVRIPPEAGILAIRHDASTSNFGKVTIEFVCGGYETVDGAQA